MQKIAEALAHMALANDDFQRAALRGDWAGPRGIVSLRLEFDARCSRFLVALPQELSDPANRALFHALQDGFNTMRQCLTAHQVGWDGARISREPDAYRAACQLVRNRVAGFLERAGSLIEAAGGPKVHAAPPKQAA